MGRGALQDVEGGHHGYGDAGDRGVGVAGFEGVYGLGHPGDADVVLDGLDDFAGGGWFGLRLGDGNGQRGECCGCKERWYAESRHDFPLGFRPDWKTLGIIPCLWWWGNTRGGSL